MNKRNTQENYLDDLLNSVSGEKTPEELEMMSLRSQLQKMRNGDESLIDSKRSAEEDFLHSFEAELEDEDYTAYVEAFEKELEAEKNQAEGIVYRDLDDIDYTTFSGKADENDESLDFIPEEMLEALEKEEVPGEETTESLATDNSEVHSISEDDLSAFGEIIGELNAEEILPKSEEGIAATTEEEITETTEVEITAATEEGEEPDLSGNSDAELMDLLAGAQGLEDIGSMLSGEEIEDVGEDSIENYSMQQMQLVEEQQEEPKKKPGLWKRLLLALFGPEDDPKEADKNEDASKEQSGISDENMKILEELDQEAKGKKKKDKKEKKEKKEKKPKKEAKPKKPKPAKEGKTKKEKPVDTTPPLPKRPMILILLLIGSTVVLVILGTNLSGYSTNKKMAEAAYKKADYLEAYQALRGVNIREEDEELYNQIMILAAVEGEFHQYKMLKEGSQLAKKIEPIEIADALVCAAGRCEINQEKAKEYDCTKELETLKAKVSKELMEQYGIAYEDAVAIYQIDDREDYSVALYQKLKELGIQTEND